MFVLYSIRIRIKISAQAGATLTSSTSIRAIESAHCSSAHRKAIITLVYFITSVDRIAGCQSGQHNTMEHEAISTTKHNTRGIESLHSLFIHIFVICVYFISEYVLVCAID